ncbi:stage III sporulation protein SpoIIIAB [Alicyclobacillus macrosporangiidus]|uniref:stage III sporulation protein SpoIIIAB n=1 Tax=Alicyclobacillus macrosporangiidus TaxID=392015 RepID=UPI000494FBFA|nr:stage III sporulation protein SpoIIIAB [Alicyclobacillus macrosporangiidus]
MKAIGAALVFVACTGIGFRIARDYRERPRQLRALMQGMRLLQAEVEYSVTPLPAALRRVSERVSPPAGVLFASAADILQDGDVPVADALARALNEAERLSALRDADLEVVREFGRTLGTSDRVHQSQQFEVAIARLAGLEEEARELQRTHERLWQYIGALVGLTIVILLY